MPEPLIASAPALRPVFLMVMGGFLLLTAWRMTRGTHGWTPRLMLAGAGLLAFGYSVVTPLYLSGLVPPLSRLGTSSTNPDTILFWHSARQIAMNAGWLIFGFGLALHAGIFESATSPAPVQTPRTRPPILREPVV